MPKQQLLITYLNHPVWRFPMEKITADTKVNEIMRMYPELTDMLMDLGLCGCGHDSTLTWSVKRISQEKGIELNSLLKELNRDDR
jgi:hypothetical protein